MEKLELLKKAIYNYLPYKVNMVDDNGKELLISELVGINENDIMHFYNEDYGGYEVRISLGSNIKLILRTLSDLTKEIEHNGEKFIPFEILGPKGKLINFNYPNLIEWGIIQKLFEWHFDIYGLIEENLAINKNEL